MQGKEGFPLGTCSACASQASRMRVACASQLYNYMLRFHLTNIVNYSKWRVQSVSFFTVIVILTTVRFQVYIIEVYSRRQL